MSRWRWVLQKLGRQLWLRATLIGSLGILAALFATVAERFLPWTFARTIGADAVDSILTIIASSMLAVTTFSLSIMTSAYGSATSTVTPRATRLLIEDRLTQNVLSTFLGSFLFGIVGLVVLKTGAYGDRGRAVLFMVTIGVIALIVITLLRWIDHLTRLGRVGETTARVEEAARRAIEARLAAPCLGARPLTDPPAEGLRRPVLAGEVGYLQHIDMPALSDCAEALACDIHVLLNPGAFVYPHTVLCTIPLDAAGGADGDASAPDGPDGLDRIRAAFTLGAERSFDQDPRFGLVVMCEIGSRALSAAVNDAGTAIDVIGRTTRLLTLWAAGAGEGPDPDKVAHPRVFLIPLREEDLFDDAFMLLARDGAGLIEVQLRLQKALAALARTGSDRFRAAARFQAGLARDRARQALTVAEDIRRLEAAAAGS